MCTPQVSARWSIGLVVALFSLSGGASPCDEALMQDAISRVLDSVHVLRDKFVAQDYLQARPCLDDIDGVSTVEIDEQLEAAYTKMQCTIGIDGGVTVCANDRDSFSVFPSWVQTCRGPSVCTLEYLVRTDEVSPEHATLAVGGGIPFGFLFGHLGKRGHYEITDRALADFAKKHGIGIAKPAMQIIRSASQDPDFYDWYTPAAHGQNESDPKTAILIITTPPAAVKFQDWTKNHLKEAASYCAKGETRKALYLLGYSLHAIQDLVFHEGISNAEHAYRDSYKSRVDTDFHYDAKMQLAKEVSISLLDAVLQETATALRPCAYALLDWRGSEKLHTDEKLALLKKEDRDLTVSAYLEFRESGEIFSEGVSCSGCRERYFLDPAWLGWESYREGNVAQLAAIRERIYYYTMPIFEN